MQIKHECDKEKGVKSNTRLCLLHLLSPVAEGDIQNIRPFPGLFEKKGLTKVQMHETKQGNVDFVLTVVKDKSCISKTIVRTGNQK